jgi:hypothetical protein
MVQCNISGCGIYCGQGVSNDSKNLARLHIGKNLDSRQGGSLKFPWGQLGGVPIYLLLPAEVSHHIGICHYRPEVVEGCLNAQIVLKARSWDPHTGATPALAPPGAPGGGTAIWAPPC